MNRIKLTIGPDGADFRVLDEDGNSTAAVALSGGREYSLSGDFTTEELPRYVSVSLVTGSGVDPGPWTYADPYGDLAYGDVVKVPFGARDRLFTGRIVASDVELPPRLVPWMVKTVAQRAEFS